MRENQSPQHSADTQPVSHLHNLDNNSHLGNLKGVSQLLSEDAPKQTVLPLEDASMDLWETVKEPEGIEAEASELENVEAKGLEGIEGIEASELEAIAAQNVETNATLVAASRSRENELLALIHDLNECNDALLSRVAQLEGDLTGTQLALQSEIEKAQHAQDRLTRQVSAEHASAQQFSQNAQQQVAKLVSQLDMAEQSLSRQQLINENLQIELTNNQERIIQLERECALLAEQHAAEAQARIKAETASRDLRSRLQRQQHYTLQFKAALEKSLAVSARPVNTHSIASIQAEAVHPLPFQDVTSVVTMPKAQRIMPWAASGVCAPFQGIDPHLETLIRGTGKVSGEPNSASTSNLSKAAAASPEAAAKLWKDLERIMNTAAEAETAKIGETVETTETVETVETVETTETVETAKTVAKEVATEAQVESIALKEPDTVEPIAIPAPETATSEVIAEDTGVEVVTTLPSDQRPSVQNDLPVAKRVSSPSSSPRLNWQAKRNSETGSSEAGSSKAGTSISSGVEIEPLIESLTASSIASSADTADTAADIAKEKFEKEQINVIAQAEAFAAAASRQSDPAVAFTEPSPWGKPLVEKSADRAIAARIDATPSADVRDYLPAMEPASAVSPHAQPLRTQKKLRSLASVELPTFPNARVSSFKR